MFLNRLKQIILGFFALIDRFLYLIFKNATSVDHSIIIFEGMMGQYDESSWVLYHYLKKKRKYRFVWMVKNPKNYSKTDDTKFISRYHYTFNIVADYYYAKAGFSFYTHTTSSTRYRRPSQKKIFIGHGYAIKGGKSNGKEGFNNFEYAIAMGEGSIATQALFIGCNECELLPLGLPRNDLLVKYNGLGVDNFFVKGTNFQRVIVWMPTFRESKSTNLSETTCATDTGLPLFDTEEKVTELNSYLSQCNCAIILKIHRLQLQKDIFKKKFSNIIIITDKDIELTGNQLYQIVGYSDALLTDYSSVSVDYALLNKPIGYILSDMRLYQKDRGFILDDPLRVMVGDHIYKMEDFAMFISNVLNNRDEYRTERNQLVKQLHAAYKGNSCELISDFFSL